jgi:hypothetical protein
MSLKQQLEQLGTFDSVKIDRVVQHGEPGREVAVVESGRVHTVFLADDRKITDDHAVRIIQSYTRHEES